MSSMFVHVESIPSKQKRNECLYMYFAKITLRGSLNRMLFFLDIQPKFQKRWGVFLIIILRPVAGITFEMSSFCA